MSFGDLQVKVGRKPITVVELDLDYCQNTYGTSPCTAAVGTTGLSKCFNGFKSCQDVANYSRGTKTYSFCTNNSFLPIGLNIFPCITGVDIAPTQLVPEEFSISASASITFQDFPHHDRGIDPYVSSRSYDPMSQGSFFGKLRSRNPYLSNRVMRVKTGYLDKDRAIYTKTRTYLIDRMEGPDADGVVRLIGKDPLRYTDDDKYTVPKASLGTLATDLSDTEILSLALAAPGVGATYAAGGVVRVDDELIQYTSVQGDFLLGLTRGYKGTEVSSHDSTAKVQQCTEYINETVPNILNDLLVNYAERDTSFITLSDWVTEAATWLPAFTSSAILSDPTSVKDVITEILQATGSSLWWDEEDAQIRFKVIIPFLVLQDVPILNGQQHILKDSAQVDDVEDQRISQVSTYHNLIDQIGDVDTDNFRTLTVQLDTDSQSEDAYGTPSNLEILSRWTPSEAYANAIGNRYLYRRRETPRQVVLQVDAKDLCKTGDLRDVVFRLMQDFEGNPKNIRFIVTEVNEVQVGTTYELTLLQVGPKGGIRPALFAPDSTPVWASASDSEKANYLFFSDNHGFMSDGSEAPTLC